MESKIKDFVDAVISMRAKQNKYFEHRKRRASADQISRALTEARDAEALVDKLAANFEQLTLL
jgi:hypothetical protein